MILYDLCLWNSLITCEFLTIITSNYESVQDLIHNYFPSLIFSYGFSRFVNAHFLKSLFSLLKLASQTCVVPRLSQCRTFDAGIYLPYFSYFGAMWSILIKILLLVFPAISLIAFDFHLVLNFVCRYDYSGYGASTGKVADNNLMLHLVKFVLLLPCLNISSKTCLSDADQKMHLNDIIRYIFHRRNWNWAKLSNW